MGSEIILYVEQSQDEEEGKNIPNVIGLTYTEAMEKLTKLGFEVVFSGDINGIVENQSPEYGISIEEGSEVTIDLASPEE